MYKAPFANGGAQQNLKAQEWGEEEETKRVHKEQCQKVEYKARQEHKELA